MLSGRDRSETNVRRTLTCLTVGGLLTLGGAAPALAHAGLMPGQYAPGTNTPSQIVIVHGCGPDGTIPIDDSVGSPTRAITVTVPTELDIEPVPTDGWTVSRSGQDLRFETTDPAGVSGAAAVDVAVHVPRGADERDVWIPAVQDCTDGEQLRWTFEGVEMGGEFAAMRTTVDRFAGMTPAEREHAERTPAWVFVAGIVALALAAGGGVVVVGGRRT